MKPLFEYIKDHHTPLSTAELIHNESNQLCPTKPTYFDIVIAKWYEMLVGETLSIMNELYRNDNIQYHNTNCDELLNDNKLKESFGSEKTLQVVGTAMPEF